MRADLEWEFEFGEWRLVFEYGDRDGSEEPCVMVQNPYYKRHGLLAYQAALVLHLGEATPIGSYISHRCRSIRCKGTACCTVSHMLVMDSEDDDEKKDNSERRDCHKLITIKANKMKQKQPKGSVKGAIKIGDQCPHKDNPCFISYGLNETDTDSVEIYVLV